jgi:chromosome segregation ATPase
MSSKVAYVFVCMVGQFLIWLGWVRPFNKLNQSPLATDSLFASSCGVMQHRGEGGVTMTNELDRRVKTLEEELNGEKHLTRYAVDQTRRNGEVLHALRTDVSGATMRLDNLAGDMAAVQSALATHGRALDVLMQDVRLLRGEMTELRTGQEAINARLDTMEHNVAGRLDTIEHNVAAIQHNVAAILAAVVPGSPPPA